jgi:hypothetical protein
MIEIWPVLGLIEKSADVPLHELPEHVVPREYVRISFDTMAVSRSYEN